MLNAAPWISAARILVMVGGAIAVGRGWATWEQVQAAASNADLLTVVAGGIAIVVPAFYAIKSRTARALVKATAKLPEVAKIEAAPALADTIPSEKVVAKLACGGGPN